VGVNSELLQVPDPPNASALLHTLSAKLLGATD